MSLRNSAAAAAMTALCLSLGNFALAREVADCTPCHELLDLRNLHEPAIFDCTTCHLAHDEVAANDQPTYANRLRGPINPLCLECHDAGKLGIKAGRGHIINNHPLSQVRDPLYPSKLLSCASCHDPHSAGQNHLFRYDYSAKVYREGGPCSVCHWRQANIEVRPPTPPWHPRAP